ncbi:unnamed protein product [Paramecium sonneborni]|uniref:SP-RING-type domain-containing protein n=1 Tax=Paramecium sonneborni TaxID=65129 RepID=A0A8S1R735_9CILI|nr:unnamed protein product [Paramecium sonneborni]
MNQNSFYDQVHPQLKSSVFDSHMLIDREEKKRYQEPVVTKDCVNHPKFCFEKKEAIQQIMLTKVYKCPICHKIAKNENDLIQDWRSQAYREFNQYITEVTVIIGIMVNKYVRKQARYQKFFMEDVYQKELKNMFDRISQENSINFLMKNNLSGSQDQQKKIQFWSFCLLDRVKITIPVRIMGCKHYECYELTSLLFYQQQNYKKKQFLECTQPGCSNRLKIAHLDYTTIDKTHNLNNVNQTQNNAAQVYGEWNSNYQVHIEEEKQKILDVQALFDGIQIDLDLLNAIKRSHPSSYKFYYNQGTQKIEEDVQIINNKYIDPLIEKYYQSNKELQQRQQFDDFQNSILQSAISVSQGDLLVEDKQLGKKIALYKYRNYKVKMVDLLTNKIIEYPVRCKFCTDLSVCMDMRSYIADFTYQKKMFPNKNYTCPLCKTQQKSILIKATIQSNIYLDSNMLSYMFKDMSYTQGTQVFEYKGQQYMLQEFMDRQKIRREDYIGNLIEFKQLFCIRNPKLRIKEPLVLSKCPQKNVVDFSTFYDELKKIDFDIENKGLTLCKCQSCNSNPIWTITGNIHFHEPFYEALNKFYKLDNYTQLKKFTYKFQKTEEKSYIKEDRMKKNEKKIKLIQLNQTEENYDKHKQQTILLRKINQFRNPIQIQEFFSKDRFINCQNDREYQKLFSKNYFSGYQYEIEQILQNMDGAEITYEKNGIHLDSNRIIQKVNSNIDNQLNEQQFKANQLSVQMSIDNLKVSKEPFNNFS